MLLVLLATAACSSEAKPEATPASLTGSYETCEGFITAQIVEDETGVSGLVDEVRILEIDSISGTPESGAINNCLIEVFRTVDGSDSVAPGESVSLSLVRFETNELAISLFHSALAAAIVTAEQVGELAEIQQGVIGNDSYLMNVKAGGIGAIVVYVYDSTFISMSSTADDESNALLGGQKLVDSAQGVHSRLP
ncbi:MAG: hypothetical protein HQ477_05185 [Chloroflexi bacterium]|nr:hypothetical protein [Chloroflexota bacterium]